MTDFIKSAVEGFFEDSVVGYGEEFAGAHFQPTKDPFYEKKKDQHGESKEVKRRLPDNIGFSKSDSKHWKAVQTSAWVHDRSICGCCCWSDFIGWAPIVTILPIIGPLCMYSVHKNLIKLADKHFNLPGDLKAKMYGNIGLDLAIALVPILGSIFVWLNACSTRNAAMVYNYIVKRQTEECNHEKLASSQKPQTERQRPVQRPTEKPQQQPSRSQQPQQRSAPPIPNRQQQQQHFLDRAVPPIPTQAINNHEQPAYPQNAYHQDHINVRTQRYPPQETREPPSQRFHL
ncbi:hypothetical protein TPHA_0F00870 [Tetrapisispora phaffii CBS 4417]|uniref:Uncharacterized protein n=1 Tax=Tetrapisispora phaffii (strain ATCC 24235 / CBS 4417 / NBRC 1672 / NRRL Y-8282 / UCD 70-5) TaxID=1071381 RepID=G8BUZ1_TETPH|nr:hypothetical protein TPHA_0F00870 [Tetrapisispora phaffii CBS 4417]CCE63573.1 hypothetical protein TPHA_0F00870 [Tetrapisispora phaffii CBS 4417]